MSASLLTSTLLPALAALTLSGQAPDAETTAAQAPEALAVEEAQEEPRTERVCRYVRRTGSTMTQRVCSNEPRRPTTGNVHSIQETREMLRRRQGSRVPDAG